MPIQKIPLATHGRSIDVRGVLSNEHPYRDPMLGRAIAMLTASPILLLHARRFVLDRN